MDDTHKCPKCSEEMEEGTYGSPYGVIFPWGKGSWFLRWISKHLDSRAIMVFRCKNCGYIESYSK